MRGASPVRFIATFAARMRGVYGNLLGALG
jgi:hypothetical protein